MRPPKSTFGIAGGQANGTGPFGTVPKGSSTGAAAGAGGGGGGAGGCGGGGCSVSGGAAAALAPAVSPGLGAAVGGASPGGAVWANAFAGTTISNKARRLPPATPLPFRFVCMRSCIRSLRIKWPSVADRHRISGNLFQGA
jgi:hypothetical protein